MPARSIATLTAAATFSIIGVRPMSSGSSCSLIAKPDGQPRLVAAARASGGREDRRVRADHAVGAAGPDDRHLLDLVGRGALRDQRLAERPVGDDPRVVVDPAVALGLADDRDHAARRPSRRRRCSLVSSEASATEWMGTLRTSMAMAWRFLSLGKISRADDGAGAALDRVEDAVQVGDHGRADRWRGRTGRRPRPWAPSSRTRSGPRRRTPPSARPVTRPMSSASGVP